MNTRYLFEIADGSSSYYHFAYFDTDEYLADFLFDHEHVEVTIEGEFGADDDPYRIIMCRIPKKDRQGFMKAIGLLPGLMSYVGKTDYDEFCRNFMAEAGRFMMNRKASGGNLPLQ